MESTLEEIVMNKKWTKDNKRKGLLSTVQDARAFGIEFSALLIHCTTQ